MGVRPSWPLFIGGVLLLLQESAWITLHLTTWVLIFTAFLAGFCFGGWAVARYTENQERRAT